MAVKWKQPLWCPRDYNLCTIPNICNDYYIHKQEEYRNLWGYQWGDQQTCIKEGQAMQWLWPTEKRQKTYKALYRKQLIG
jgi:hypothetical protein